MGEHRGQAWWDQALQEHKTRGEKAPENCV